jgi:hypothetical protein
MALEKSHKSMSHTKRILIPIAAGLIGILFLASIYFGLMSWAEGFKSAWGLFWYDRWIVIPILLGFGIQAALFAVLKFRTFVPDAAMGPSGALMGASGTTSTIAMLACCVHHVTDVLPILGLTAASAFLGRYRTAFMLVGLGTTLIGILAMLIILAREWRKVHPIAIPNQATEIP